MRVLILGGTVFVGRQLVGELHARGHEVVLFNRGKSNPGLFPEVEQIHGDRMTDLSRLGDRQFDAVFDPSAYTPGEVRVAAEFLRDRASHYTFISTISVYDLSQTNIDEDSPLLVLPSTVDPDASDMQYYGELKVLCENEARKHFGDERTLVIRPGLIVGPQDPTDRFSYWPHRFTETGKVAAPPGPNITTQFIDARDLGKWAVRMIERKRPGTFNATSPPGEISFGDVLNACAEAAAARFSADKVAGDILWMDEAFLDEQKVSSWSDLPLWMSTKVMPGLLKASVARAQAEGLEFRPVTTIVKDTLEWILTERGGAPWKSGLSKDRETALVQAFLSRA